MNKFWEHFSNGKTKVPITFSDKISTKVDAIPDSLTIDLRTRKDKAKAFIKAIDDILNQ